LEAGYVFESEIMDENEAEVREIVDKVVIPPKPSSPLEDSLSLRNLALLEVGRIPNMQVNENLHLRSSNTWHL